jgi:very-short-patch-repair endonuclease
MLDIEVDGERYHRNWTGELCRRDQLRNQRLFELGWDVLRFWVYEIRDDTNGCVERVKQWLNNSN